MYVECNANKEIGRTEFDFHFEEAEIGKYFIGTLGKMAETLEASESQDETNLGKHLKELVAEKSSVFDYKNDEKIAVQFSDFDMSVLVLSLFFVSGIERQKGLEKNEELVTQLRITQKKLIETEKMQLDFFDKYEDVLKRANAAMDAAMGKAKTVE